MSNRRYLQVGLLALILTLGAAACGPFAGTTSPTATPAGASNPAATPGSTTAGVSVGSQSTPAPTPASASTAAATSAPGETPGGVSIGQTRAIKNVNNGLDKLKSYQVHVLYAFDGKDKAGLARKGSIDYTHAVINATTDQHLKIGFTGNPIGATGATTSAGTPSSFEQYQVGGNTFIISAGKCQFVGSGQSSTLPGGQFSLDTFIGTDKATLVAHGESVNGINVDHYTFTEAAVTTSLNGMKLTQGDAWVSLDGYLVKLVAQASGTMKDGADGTINVNYNLENVNSVQPIVAPADCVAPAQVTDIPIPPNATGKQVFAPSAGQSVTTFKSPDPLKTVADFYRQAMPGQGWTAAGDTSSGAASITLTYTKNAGKRTVTVNVVGLGGATTVFIMDKTGQ